MSRARITVEKSFCKQPSAPPRRARSCFVALPDMWFWDDSTSPVRASAATLLGSYGLSFEGAKRNIRHMAPGLLKLASRLAVIACGVISILLSRTFRSFQRVMPTVNVNWRLFSTALMLVGGLTLFIALLPSSWLESACNSGSPTEDRSSVPIKLLLGFAVFSYLFTVGLNFAPLNWHVSANMVYLVCPACLLTITVDPSFGTVLLVLAPLNAAVYGSLGAILGYFFLAVRNRI
jgi:hypothetical protein